MEIRIADVRDKSDIIALYERSQVATGLPDPALIPQSELGERLYRRNIIEHFVAIETGKIVGHAMIEEPNCNHESSWRNTLNNTDKPLIEMGGAFVEPALTGRGIWTGMLRYRLHIIRDSGAHPVTATWSKNEHVKRTLRAYGGIAAGLQSTSEGDIDLFVFQ